MKTNTWQLQEAKSKFSHLVEKALHNGPQFVTKHGNDAVVILSFKEYPEITRPKSDLVAFLRSSPLANLELDISRDKNPPREIGL
ncbi:MAG: type II toxin-antitoxin system Phd/YefM family antitoxin [Methylococcaceae bacterium]